MIVIFTGVDCSGKSTLLSEFSKGVFPHVVVKRPKELLPNFGGNLDTLYSSFSSVLKLARDNPKFFWLVDRFVESEIVYSYKRGLDLLPLLDDNRAWNNKFVKMHNELKGAPDVLWVLVHEDVAVIQKRLGLRGDDYIVSSEVPRLNLRFEKYFEALPGHKVVVGPGKTPVQMSDEIKEVLADVFVKEKMFNFRSVSVEDIVSKIRDSQGDSNGELEDVPRYVH